MLMPVKISIKMRMNLLVILLPLFLLQLSTELLVAQEVRYEQNALIRIDSLSSGVILKPESSSAPAFSSPVDGNPFSYEFELPEGLLRIQEMLSGCQECAPPAGDKGYTIEEIESVLRKLLAERGIALNLTATVKEDSSISTASRQDIESGSEEVLRTNRTEHYSVTVDELTRQEQAHETEKTDTDTLTTDGTVIAKTPPRPQIERKSLEEMIARVRRDFSDHGRFTDQKIQFAFDSYELRPESFQLLNAVGTYMIENPNQQILITGNTCTIGPLEYNYRLSELRAESVATYLKTTFPQINEDLITTEGHGPDNPIADNDNPEVRFLNRRVEFIIKDN
jgi:outer membrane protein OmpA-like peptidoglycan-associated protein